MAHLGGMLCISVLLFLSDSRIRAGDYQRLASESLGTCRCVISLTMIGDSISVKMQVYEVLLERLLQGGL